MSTQELGLLIATFVAGIVLGSLASRGFVASDCADFGHFRVGEAMYECKKVLP